MLLVQINRLILLWKGINYPNPVTKRDSALVRLIKHINQIEFSWFFSSSLIQIFNWDTFKWNLWNETNFKNALKIKSQIPRLKSQIFSLFQRVRKFDWLSQSQRNKIYAIQRYYNKNVLINIETLTWINQIEKKIRIKYTQWILWIW